MRNSIKKYTVAIMAIAAMIATPGCTDSWNDHFADNIFGSGKSVWERIQEDPELSTFAGMVKKAHYYRDEKHMSSYTFDQLLDGNRSVTVWAPTNEALANDSDQWKAEAEALPYDFQKQFIMNCIAFGKYDMSQSSYKPEVDTLRFRLINNKYATIWPDEDLVGSRKASAATVVEKDIPARNGVLNKIKNLSSYDCNVYEYIKYTTDEDLSENAEYIVDHDTIYYDATNSIQGYPDEYGDPTIIDSVFKATDNLLFGSKGYNSYLPLDYKYNDTYYKYMSYEKMFNTDINNEDSVYAMITLTNAGYENGRSKMKPLYKYSEKYPNMERMQSLTTGSNTTEQTFYANNITLNVGDVDSLAEFNMSGIMNSTTVFNLNMQPRDLNNGYTWTPETFKQYHGQNCRYLLNTYGNNCNGDTLRLDGDKAISAQKDQSSLFKGFKKAVIGSNGVNFEMDTWNYPESYYNPTLDLNLNTSYRWVEYGKTGTDSYSIELKSISGDTLQSMYQKICDPGVDGIVRNNFVITKTSNTKGGHDIYFQLREKKDWGTQIYSPRDKQVASEKYNIDIVVVPYYLSVADTIPTSSTDTLNNKLANQFSATVYYYDPAKCQTCKFSDMATSETVNLTYSGEKVQKFRLFSNFEFPVSYRDMIYTYPLLRIQTKAPTTKKRDPETGKASTVNQYTPHLCIDRIILTPVN